MFVEHALPHQGCQEGRECVRKDHQRLVDLSTSDALIREDQRKDQSEGESRQHRTDSKDKGPHQGTYERLNQAGILEHCGVVRGANKDSPAGGQLVPLAIFKDTLLVIRLVNNTGFGVRQSIGGFVVGEGGLGEVARSSIRR